MVTYFKRAYAMTPVFSAPDPTAAAVHPCLWPEPPGHSQASSAPSLVGSHCCFLLGPGVHKVLLVASSVWVVCSVAQCWGSSAAPPGSAAARAPSTWQVTADLCLLLRRRHSNPQRQVWLSVGSLGSGAHELLFEPSDSA